MLHIDVPIHSQPLTVGNTMATVMPSGGGGGGAPRNLSSFGPYGTPPHGAPVLQPQPGGSPAIHYGPQNLPGGARTFGYRRAWPGAWGGWGGWGWPWGWGSGAYWGAPVAVYSPYPQYQGEAQPDQPATPEEVFGSRVVTQQQADQWCQQLYWPWCQRHGDEAFCHRYAAACLSRLNGK